MLDLLRLPDGMTGDASQIGAELGAKATANLLRIVESPATMEALRLARLVAVGLLALAGGWLALRALSELRKEGAPVRHEVVHRSAGGGAADLGGAGGAQA